ncbi:aquaporin AQPcic isoform X3 [Cephus cinctus]|nr:aquaporin AQPcic isoform X3 [Cephus cinctus]
MEQNGISMISASSVTENSSGSKIKSANIVLSKGNEVQMQIHKVEMSWFRKLMQEDGSVWDTFLMGLAEFIGTAMLLFIGCLGCSSGLGTVRTSFQSAFAFGLTVMTVLQCIGHISAAHINPAVTVGSVILGKKSIPTALVYLVAQITGGILGFGLLRVVTPQQHLHAGNPEDTASFCMTLLNDDITVFQGFLMEILATGVLMFLTCALWDSRNEKNIDSVSVRVGLTVTCLSLTVGPYTGCSMNPARSLAPAIWNNQWSHHWIFWFGPIAGAILATLLYKTLFWPKDIDKDKFADDHVVLNGVHSLNPE